MALKQKRGSYLWVTWVTGLLAGTDHCAWAPWLRAHYTFEKKQDGGGDALSRWMAAHDDLLKERMAELAEDGWNVEVEDQNKFTVRGVSSIGGKPDIVAFKGDEVRISDPKGGKRKHKYIWQMRMYMVLLPMQDARLNGRTITGELVYPDGLEEVTLEDGDAERIFAQIRETGSGPEPKTTPSASECRYCPISECKDRVTETRAAGTTYNF